MIGCTRRQMTWKVMVPSARRGLMVGVNQVIMLSLNMVIIASMIGAGGLGFDVLAALRRLDIGAGIEAGVAIVVLAIALDRLSQAFAVNSEVRARAAAARAGEPFYRRFPNVTAACVIVVTAGILGLFYPPLQVYPDAWTVTTGGFWEGIVRWINVNFFDALDAFKIGAAPQRPDPGQALPRRTALARGGCRPGARRLRARRPSARGALRGAVDG